MDVDCTSWFSTLMCTSSSNCCPSMFDQRNELLVTPRISHSYIYIIMIRNKVRDFEIVASRFSSSSGLRCLCSQWLSSWSFWCCIFLTRPKMRVHTPSHWMTRFVESTRQRERIWSCPAKSTCASTTSPTLSSVRCKPIAEFTSSTICATTLSTIEYSTCTAATMPSRIAFVQY